MSLDYLFLGLGWAMYYALHSLLASHWVKDALARRWPRVGGYYRLGYNALALFLLLLLVIWQYQLPTAYWWPPTLLARFLGGLLMAGGGFVMAATFRNYDTRAFLGLKPEDISAKSLTVNGLNRWVRHPLYLGVLFFIAGYVVWETSWRQLVFPLLTLLYLPIGIALEEQKLLARFGEAYGEYRAKVKMIIPGIW
ncbi:MAG: isoprenylcysteine carboxylmethyltransferase family protein [Microscillaceae bacterium]|nr:isoprenylcysteine carboxylmethyltransferase family protein [Microscillaceae bacterium]